MLLAGDVGGTKVHLGIFAADKGPREPLIEATFSSAGYAGLDEIVTEFLNGVEYEASAACFGVAGPVVGGRATITNLSWVIDAGALAGKLGFADVYLLNDLESIANSVPILEPEDLHVLNRGRAEPKAAIAVIAPGTGLGEAFLTWDGAHYRAHPSEGGHADFAPANELQVGLWQFLRKYGHVSCERACSGLGLPDLYAYLQERGDAPEPDWLADKMAAADDVNPIIVDAALDRQPPCALASAALDLFVSILGAEAGNLAVKVLATGGVYLGGGIPPRILPALETGTFINAFLNKGRFNDLMARIPVQVILNPRAPIMGAARYGLEQM